MSGNVWEFSQDFFDDLTNDRMDRGGGWSNNAGFCRVSIRNRSTPSFCYYFLGLRLAL